MRKNFIRQKARIPGASISEGILVQSKRWVDKMAQIPTSESFFELNSRDHDIDGMYKWLIWGLLGGIFGCPQLVSAQAERECGYLWNGFRQAWGYNHRINRLGDLVDVQRDGLTGCRAALVHTAATGSGPDVALFSSGATRIEAAGARFKYGKVRLSLEGREGEWLRNEVVVRHFAPSLRTPNAHATALLNGFDLVTAAGAKADKPRKLAFGIDSVWTDMDRAELCLRLYTEMDFACSTFECERFRNEVRYNMDLHYVIVVGDVAVTDARRAVGYSWMRDSVPKAPPVQQTVLGEPNWAIAALGFREVSLELDAEHHYLRLGFQSAGQGYDPSSGTLVHTLYLQFQQWDPTMYEQYHTHYDIRPKPPAKWVLKRHAGSALLAVKMQLLQFREGRIVPQSVHGSLHWHSRHSHQTAAQDTSAVWRQEMTSVSD